jgi:hypothetical protein
MAGAGWPVKDWWRQDPGPKPSPISPAVQTCSSPPSSTYQRFEPRIGKPANQSSFRAVDFNELFARCKFCNLRAPNFTVITAATIWHHRCRPDGKLKRLAAVAAHHASFHRPSRASTMMQTLVRATNRTTGFCDSATNCLAGFWQSTRSRIHEKSHGRAGLAPITLARLCHRVEKECRASARHPVETANDQVRRALLAAGDGS